MLNGIILTELYISWAIINMSPQNMFTSPTHVKTIFIYQKINAAKLIVNDLYTDNVQRTENSINFPWTRKFSRYKVISSSTILPLRSLLTRAKFSKWAQKKSSSHVRSMFNFLQLQSKLISKVNRGEWSNFYFRFVQREIDTFHPLQTFLLFYRDIVFSVVSEGLHHETEIEPFSSCMANPVPTRSRAHNDIVGSVSGGISSAMTLQQIGVIYIFHLLCIQNSPRMMS